MIKLQKSEQNKKGSWRERNGRLYISCPGCGLESVLSESQFVISSEGEVVPSIKCEQASCDFFGDVKLEKWTWPAT